MDVRYLLLLILLVSCLPTEQVSKGNLASNGTNTTGGSTGGTTTIPEAPTRWNYLSNLTSAITINASNLNSAYIVGKNIETFLNGFTEADENYCLVGRYSISGVTRELRTRVVRISYYDFTAKRTVQILRSDFNDVSASQTICSSLPLRVLDSSGNYIADTSVVSLTTTNPGQLCTTCTSSITSTKLTLYHKVGAELFELPLSSVDIRTLSLSVDPNNNVSTNPGTCSQSDCVARGFDCCLDNQCIKDGTIRPSAQTQYYSQLQAAEAERLQNPLAFLNYPHLYYICGSSVPSTTGGSTGGGDYTQGLTQLMKDYYCVEHMKKYKTGSTFHQDLVSGVQFFPDEVDIPDVQGNASTLYPTDIECRNDTDSSSNMYFKKVAERLYQQCGCAKTTLADMVAYCPAYEYSVNYVESSGLPNRIDCYTPNTGTPQIPLQQTVSVNSRSAPHRYFRTCGDEFGSNGTCSTGDNQEGDVFFYQDDGHILPVQENFGMNSILGQMTVTLDKALPAKTVAVELDQVYQISTTSGFYTPCPTCGKDSWFSAFSPFPTTANGAGLQSIGFSTQRDFYDGNSTGGNYEDTIFGRACWLPPTMLPFSHSPMSNTQSQRLARLKTQAALYSNGYQKDWYGFNKGALIGSFDGVTWFAVGKGRIVRSTSTKLFLAINAPFADLASPTLHVVNVLAYDGITQLAQVDYDPQYHLSHAYQNNAGTCQANHLCSTDQDCISRLGWEYMCADVANVNTQWPQFDVDAKEKAGLSSVLTIDQVLQQKRFPSSDTKRCVYRGAGAPCIQTPGVVSDLNQRKTVTCAPNFYCANVNTGGAVFNSKVSRYASNLEDIPVVRNHYFGKDANVLGRPLSYVASSLSTSLPSDVRTNLIQNMSQYVSNSTSITGICLPGKALPDSTNQATMFNPYEQHRIADAQGRTDFISQIGSCNSGLFTSNRYASCPVINSDGNYDFLSTTFNTSTYAAQARNQNACGLDTLLTNVNLNSGVDTLSPYSPFRAIEAKPLSTSTVQEPSFARDACLRRAGSVCHTDLDCGPNKKFADQVDNFSLAYFGNEAEKKYYSEYLVCGQADPKPAPTDTTAYKAYSMSNNRCCREVGSDLTTFTSYIPLKLNPIMSTNQDATTANDSYDSISYGLKMATAPGIAPNDQYRYSRLATVENLGSVTRPPLNAFQDRQTGLSTLNTAQSANVMTPYQWKTLSEANSDSCCGGGWIRKFADGGNDWTRRDRMYIDVKNFACINSRNVMLTKPSDAASYYNSAADALTLANADIGDYCKDISGTKGSCAQFTIADKLTEDPPGSSPFPTLSTSGNAIDHFKTYGMSWGGSTPLHKDFYYYPKSADGDPAIIIDYTQASARRNIMFRMPSYISRSSFDVPMSTIPIGGGPWTTGATRIEMFEIGSTNEGKKAFCTRIDESAFNSFVPGSYDTVGGSTDICPSGQDCCYSYNPSTRILRVVPEYNNQLGLNGITASTYTKKVAVKVINATSAQWSGPNRQKPGSNSYYLKRLGRMELAGIPQVTYSPLTCSDNSDRMVPGLFKDSTTNDMMYSSNFAQDYFSFQQGGFDSTTTSLTFGRFTNVHGLAIEPIFSENDFKCCTPLGKTTSDQNKCCSGYGIATPSGTTFTCALPSGTDLMVYFNRYVSNEGIGTDKPGGGLLETDFDSITGEPKLTSVINQKVSALGSAYCASGKVRQGGAFGEFPLEPQGNDTTLGEKIYGIVDSSKDEGQLSNAGGTVPVGYSAFMAGFRWNHHLYCDDVAN